ncbi:MAG: hypothetical protein LBQ61_00350 [Spirochaetales bacterium]|jgi:class 3 adenylate cyclase|nr:hypothetical protein [Spirochaetales bacterium]
MAAFNEKPPEGPPPEPFQCLDEATLQALRKMPVDILDGLYLGETRNNALVLCLDIRNFSKFLRDSDEERVFTFMRNFSSNFLSCVNQFGFHCSYYKLLGDGAIVIWDEATGKSLAEALDTWTQFVDFANEELFRGELGLGGALVMEKVYKYEISAEIAGLKYRDYVGYGINLACRLQTLAKINQLIIGVKLVKTGRVPVIPDEGLDENGFYLKGLREQDQGKLYFYNPPR